MSGLMTKTLQVKTGNRTDQLIFTFEGEGMPAYDVRYIEKPIDTNTGDAVSLGGEAYLAITLAGLGLPDSNITDPPPSKFSIEGDIVQDRLYFPFFEGQDTTYLGLDKKRAFSVSTSSKGTKTLIIDIAR